MKKGVMRKRSRKGRLNRLARALINCASPDIYFDPNQRYYQIAMPLPETETYGCVAAEQLSILARVENYDLSSPRSRS